MRDLSVSVHSINGFVHSEWLPRIIIRAHFKTLPVNFNVCYRNDHLSVPFESKTKLPSIPSLDFKIDLHHFRYRCFERET